MKKILFTTSLIGLIFGASSFVQPKLAAETSLNKYDVYNLINSNYHIEGDMVVSYSFPSNYANNNSSTSVSINRDYGKLIDNNVSYKAVNEYANNTKTTYYESDDGLLVTDYYSYDNKTFTNEVYPSMNILFEDVYSNPFEYIDVSDIGDDLSLSNQKASFILDTFFSTSCNVDSAKFVVENNSITGIEFNIDTKEGGFVTTSGVSNFDISYKASLSLDFEGVNFVKLQPSNNDNPNLRTALNNLKDNFTLILSSPSMTNSVAYYVTNQGILLKQNYNYYGLQVGDIFYKKNGTNYATYTYTPGLVSNWVRGSNVSYEAILPDFTKVSEKLFNQVSSSNYALVDGAKTFLPDYFAPVSYSLGEDNGIDGYIRLVNNQVGLISMSHNYGVNIVTYNENIIDLGSTSFPSYIDVSTIQ